MTVVDIEVTSASTVEYYVSATVNGRTRTYPNPKSGNQVFHIGVAALGTCSATINVA